MASPSDDATQTDLEALFAASPGFAAQQLESIGGFFPYAAHLGVDDTIGLMAADADLLAENPAETAIVDSLTEVLAMGASELRATAVVANGTTAEGEVITVHLEHRSGVSVRITIPYTRGESGVVVHDPAGSEPVAAIVFG